jgi:predicted membrane chloride channel (bestrophin family)
LVVIRSSIAYNRFMEARGHLESALVASRELVQHVVVFTRKDRSDRARLWRSEVARRSIVLLRCAEAVLQNSSHESVHASGMPELAQAERHVLLRAIAPDQDECSVHIMTLFLRSTLAAHAESLATPLSAVEQARLWNICEAFVKAFHGMLKLTTTPFPFPMVQMARFFLFVWIYTLPFALVNVIQKLPALLVLVFCITFGFIGLEQVSIELDDPYGDDDGNIPIEEYIRIAVDDMALSIYDVDGQDAARVLLKSVFWKSSGMSDANNDEAYNLTDFADPECATPRSKPPSYAQNVSTVAASPARSSSRPSCLLGNEDSVLLNESMRRMGGFSNEYGATASISALLEDYCDYDDEEDICDPRTVSTETTKSKWGWFGR